MKMRFIGNTFGIEVWQDAKEIKVWECVECLSRVKSKDQPECIRCEIKEHHIEEGEAGIL